MNTVTDETTRVWLDRFGELEDQLTGRSAPWLRQVRRAALSQFAEHGLPTTRVEEWKYTSLHPIRKRDFAPTPSEPATLSEEELARVRVAGLDCHELVFVDGVFSREHSRINNLPEGVVATDLGTALADNPEALEPHLAHYATHSHSSFTALNTAFLEDGACVQLLDDVELDKPLHLAFVSTNRESPIVCHPRVLVIAGSGSRARIVESYVGLEGAGNLTNAVTEMVLGPRARIDHYRLQRESTRGFHIGGLHVRQHEDSRFVSHNVNIGGRLVRNDLRFTLVGEGAEAVMNGFYMGEGRQHVDNHTWAEHEAPRTYSDEYYKGILNGRARGVFNGLVHVHPDAQQIAAHQKNANLVLSRRAEIDTKPELLIYADDVECSHGATVGQLDDDALFYLRSRGLDEEMARNVLIHAFADDVTSRINLEPVRRLVEDEILGHLPDSERINETV